jgi:hypothetical protein
MTFDEPSEQQQPAHAVSPADRYKAITAEITGAVEAVRERDRARAAELTRVLAELDDAMTRVGDRVALSRLAVELHWEAALEALWSESWMTLRPMPSPEPTPPGSGRRASLDELDEAVAARFAELSDAVHRRRLGLRR